MRALRVVGLDGDGETVILEDPDRGERFLLPADDRLRAAARGDLARLGQAQIELESQIRPREIQARIRAGESVEQVAAAAGVPVQRIERFAYPVLLERSRTAELAQRAHPVREDGPDVQTLGEVVAHSFGLRGQDYAATNWDSWRGEDGKWVVRLTWRAGRSDNRAHWLFHPGAHGGTVTPLDEHAVDLIDPSPNRPLRTVRPVTQLAREALELDAQQRADEGMTMPVDHSVLLEDEPEQAVVAQPAAEPEPEAQPAATAPEPEAQPEQPAAAEEPAEEAEPESAAQNQQNPGTHAPARRTESGSRRGRKNHPIVPSWEDVLLGVRSQRT